MSAEKQNISISGAYDGGNIQYSRTENDCVYLNIKPDPFTELEQTEHFQYFSFRATIQPDEKAEGINCVVDDDEEDSTTTTYIIENAGKCSYPWAWPGSTVFQSTDFDKWTRVLNTSFDAETGHLKWTTSNQHKIQYFAYFPPYSYDRHLKLISQCARAQGSKVKSLGQTLDGREMDCVIVGNGPLKAWIIHRQHPGETMAEFFAEGLLTRLLGLGNHADFGSIDGTATRLRNMFTFYIVPNMCPDGSFRGHLRTNAIGTNLNREWCNTESKNYEAPTLERSPEVYYVLMEMDRTGVDFFADIHGDEALPFNFIAGNEGIPNWDDRLQSLHGAFLASYSRANSDIQSAVSYPPAKPKTSNLAICSKQIGARFDCLSFTLEMPFKDCLSNPDPERGWNPKRSQLLGQSLLDALLYVQPFLRADNVGSHSFPKEDAYVRPTANFRELFSSATKTTNSDTVSNTSTT